ncbi:DUF4224 domain-containing protein [Pseudomonas sp. NPDC086581]|uniref:DUF4224 domain-containing protein n=1 Tax=Pseudomonas sp. NPDC086581 TaxID=3364432 RepID=UPI0037FFD9EF
MNTQSTREPVSEFLTEAELKALVGRELKGLQIKWLKDHHWIYEINAAGRPVVGRIYARMKLAGVKPTSSAAVQEPWQLDLSKVS